jgi:D-aminopeptidase
MQRARLRELGIAIGRMRPGAANAITDVPGVRVGYADVISDREPVARTGVTAIWPAGKELWESAVFAGCHSFNGNGEMTGAAWLHEQGLLSAPIAITTTQSVGVVRDALYAYALREGIRRPWLLPVAAETYDGWLSAAPASAINQEVVFSALDHAKTGPIREGNVGGGVGTICHEFKGGTGTASRLISVAGESFTVGVLTQTNYGRRDLLTVAGVPVGRHIDYSEVPSPRPRFEDAGSIIVVIATDAPLLPIQCQRVARRATLGLARVGGIGGNGSGDLFVAFSTATRVPIGQAMHHMRFLDADVMNDAFEAAAEATEEAILNSLTAAETSTGQQGRVAHALPLDRVAALVAHNVR